TGRPFDPLGDRPDPWTQRVPQTGMPRRPFAISRLERSTSGGGTIGSRESPSPGRSRTGPSSEPVAADDRSGLRGSGPGQSGLLDIVGQVHFSDHAATGGNNMKGQVRRPTAAFIGASWLALFVGVIAYLVGLWNSAMPLNERGYYFTVLMFGL